MAASWSLKDTLDHMREGRQQLVGTTMQTAGEVFQTGSLAPIAEKAAQAFPQIAPVVDSVLEKTQIVTANAKRALADPLSTVMRVLNKAVPAAIASCASLQYTGGIGSFENFLSPLYLRMKFFAVDGDRAAFVGRPCFKTARLSTLTGFCLCENVKLDLPGTSTEPPATLEEQQIVVQYLEAGVYLE